MKNAKRIYYLSYPSCCKHQVVIMYPYERKIFAWCGRTGAVLGFRYGFQSPYGAISKFPIGDHVVLVMFSFEGGSIRHRVKQWPKNFVAASVVV